MKKEILAYLDENPEVRKKLVDYKDLDKAFELLSPHIEGLTKKTLKDALLAIEYDVIDIEQLDMVSGGQIDETFDLDFLNYI